jgi:hypothetical protein
MEPSQVQLILNVIGITAVTSLTTMRILHRREKRERVEGRERHSPPAQEQDVRKLAEAKRAEWVQSLSSAISFAQAVQQDR